MDGRGRAFDNIFVERRWRSVKYEDIYIKEYDTVPTPATGLEDYFRLYNNERPHQSLDYLTLADIHFVVRVISQTALLEWEIFRGFRQHASSILFALPGFHSQTGLIPGTQWLRHHLPHVPSPAPSRNPSHWLNTNQV
jgi:hypothetical protein